MASTTNAFDLLVGAEQALSKKKKKAAKKAEEPAPAVPVAPVAAAKGGVAGASSGVVQAVEACAILERAAREAKSISDKVKLWRDWIRQARHLSLAWLPACLIAL